MEIINLEEPRALLIPDIQNLLRNAIDSGVLVGPYGFDTVAEDLFAIITDPQQFMFLGAEDGKFKSIVMGFLPTGNLFPYPTITLFYNEGSRSLSVATREAVMDFIVSKGYTRTLAVNSSGYPDKVWLRGLQVDGLQGQIVGSLGLFEVK